MQKFVSIVITLLLLSYYPFVSSNQENKILEIINEVNEESLYYYDKTIQDFGPHPTGSEAWQKLAEFIYNEFKSYGLNVEYDEWKVNKLEGKNVVATLPGKDNYTVIISAHYDSVAISPGADDDGSGISCVLMAAKILSRYSFQHTIKFIAFSGEEEGLYGSTHYARNAYENGEIVIADLQLDGVGHAAGKEGGNRIRISANDASTWITDVAEEMTEKYGEEIGLKIIRHRNFPGSDHQSFLNYGYEGVFFLEYEFNPHYHSPQDTIENVNISYLTKVCKLAVATLAALADKDIFMIVRIVEPERGAIYFGSKKIMELESYNTIVFGKIHAKAKIMTEENIKRVEFYFDGELRGVDDEAPFEYTYGKIAAFNHIIKAIAYGEGSEDINEIELTVFNFLPKYWLN